MTSQSLSRPATLVAGAVVLGAAFWLGSHSGGDANAATFVPAATAPSSTGTAPAATSGAGITVTGEAKVAGKPDTLSLTLSVSHKADTVQAALERANGTISTVQSALKRSGVADKDLQTTGLDIEPSYSYPRDGTPTITGYTATERLTATLRDLGTAGRVITDATRAGGDAVQVHGINLDIADTSKLAASARDRAVANAKAKAEQFAKAAGRALGPVVSLTESVSTSPPIAYDTRAMAADAKAVPIAAGSQDVTVSVTVVYAFR